MMLTTNMFVVVLMMMMSMTAMCHEEGAHAMLTPPQEAACSDASSSSDFDCSFKPFSTMEFFWNKPTTTDNVTTTTSVMAKVPNGMWASVGFSESGFMIPALAAVGIPGGDAQLHLMTSKSTPEIVAGVVNETSMPLFWRNLPPYAPNMTDLAVTTSETEGTVLTFNVSTTSGEIPNKVIFAHGSGSDLMYHGFFNKGRATLKWG